MSTDDYMVGYMAGLNQTESVKNEKVTPEYIHGFGDALYDLLDATDYIDS